MKIDLRAGLVIVAAWLLTCAAAFWMGGSRRAPDSAEVDGGAADSFVESTPATDDVLTITGKSGTVDRFIDFTSSLGGDELARILPEMTEKMDGGQVLDALQRLTDEVEANPARRRAKFELIDRWAQLDPEAAIAAIEAMADPKMRHDLKWRGIKGWASVDPEGAINYVSEAKGLPDHSIKAIWRGIEDTKDLGATLDFISTCGPDLDQLSSGNIWSVDSAVRAVYKSDDRRVIAWVEELPQGSVRDDAISGMVSQWAIHDPRAAVDWIEKHADPSNITGARMELAGAWAGSDPIGAEQWAESLSLGADDLQRMREHIQAQFAFPK